MMHLLHVALFATTLHHAASPQDVCGVPGDCSAKQSDSNPKPSNTATPSHTGQPLFQELGRDGTPMAFTAGGWFLSKTRGVVMSHVVNFDRTDCSTLELVGQQVRATESFHLYMVVVVHMSTDMPPPHVQALVQRITTSH